MNIRVETEKTTGNKNKIIIYAKTEPKAKENTLADRQQHELKTKLMWTKASIQRYTKINQVIIY